MFILVPVTDPFSDAAFIFWVGFIKFGIDFYLVGATARDVWLKGVHGLPPKRAARDIDFTIMINDSMVFDELKSYLINEEAFVPYKENQFV